MAHNKAAVQQILDKAKADGRLAKISQKWLGTGLPADL